MRTSKGTLCADKSNRPRSMSKVSLPSVSSLFPELAEGVLPAARSPPDSDQACLSLASPTSQRRAAEPAEQPQASDLFYLSLADSRAVDLAEPQLQPCAETSVIAPCPTQPVGQPLPFPDSTTDGAISASDAANLLLGAHRDRWTPSTVAMSTAQGTPDLTGGCSSPLTEASSDVSSDTPSPLPSETTASASSPALDTFRVAKSGRPLKRRSTVIVSDTDRRRRKSSSSFSLSSATNER